MEKRIDFTEGEIVRPLIRFVGPVFCALFLQALYGAVDLMIVGKFAESADVSAVATGSMIMMTITNLVSSLAMGMTILLGQKIGERKPEEGGRIVGSGILLFLTAGILMTVLTAALAPQLAGVMHAPAEAFGHTTDYIRICGTGIIVIISYNLIGSIFRGIGDSATPFMTVLIACICNIAGDLLLVAGFGMGTRGAIRWDGTVIKKILLLGIPIALQDLLVGVSFLVIMAIVNSLGLICSAGVGVAEKVCGFIMLVPAAFMQSMSAIAAQNIGAGKPDRAVRGLFSAIGISTVFGVLMFYVTHRLHADLFPVLLYRLLQRRGLYRICHDAGHRRGLPHEGAGILPHEPEASGVAVPYRTGDALLQPSADHAVLYLLCGLAETADRQTYFMRMNPMSPAVSPAFRAAL